jgi:oligoendopeptidase F
VPSQPTGPSDWDLTALYDGGDDPRLDRDAEAAAAAAAAFAARYRGNVARLEAEELATAVAELERITALSFRLQLFAELHQSAQTDDPARGRLFARMQERRTAIDNELKFFGLEWTTVSNEEADRRLAAPELADRSHFLAATRRFGPHQLPEGEERLLAEASLTGNRAFSRLYGELLARARVDLQGEQMTLDEASAVLLSDLDRDRRRAAVAGINDALAPDLPTKTFIFNVIARARVAEDRMRGYPSWISFRNLTNQISDATVETLVTAVVERRDIARRHVRLRASLLGVETLEAGDIEAPVGERPFSIGWDESDELVRESFMGLSPRAGEVASVAFAERWIDAAPREGKMTGAFCATRTPGAHPYVLMTFTGDRLAVSTLAHELGHALHSVLAEDRGFFGTDIPLTLSETASLFAETLVLDRLGEGMADPRSRLDLLMSRIDSIVLNVFFAISAFRFEDEVHRIYRSDGELAPEQLDELWLREERLLRGDDADPTQRASWWSSYPHPIFAPGYLYAYAFGCLLALAAYRRYKEAGDSFVEPFFAFLRDSGSEQPEILAGRLGFDTSSPEFWNLGLDVVDELVTEAEKLGAATS